MIKISFWKIKLTAFAVLVAFVLFTSCTKQPPNVILIMTDDQGYGDLACHGNPDVKTPALDKLYEESVRFTDFHVDPCCAPTRSALLTGCYSSRAGVWHTIGGRSLLKEGMATVADVFQDNGYETAIFGKWHLGENYPFRPQDRGFKEVLVHGGGVVGSNPGYWGNDYYDDTFVHNGKFEKYEGYCNTVWFSEALKYIQKNKENPFFCFVSTNVPHAPLRVDKEYAEPYQEKFSDRLANYYGMITKMDEDIGHFLNELKEMSLDENTILIFMTDNGPCPWFGGIDMDFETGYPKEGYSAGMRGGKIWGYENAHRVPFYIRWPAGGIGGGKDIETLSAHIDVLPTLADLCDLKWPGELECDGQSLEPLFRGEKEFLKNRTLFVHNQRVSDPVKDKEYQVLTHKWRLVKRDKDELYDIKKDPGQKNDIAGQHPEIVEQLYAKYEEWWDDTSEDFDQYAEIYVGSEYENPVTLYSHDAHSLGDQKVWVIKVAREGRYEIRLNRWPEESGKRIVENSAGDKELPINEAFLKVGNQEIMKRVNRDMTTAGFVVDLKAGTTCLHTALKMSEGRSARTDCVYVKFLGAADQEKLGRYDHTAPSAILKQNNP